MLLLFSLVVERRIRDALNAISLWMVTPQASTCGLNVVVVTARKRSKEAAEEASDGIDGVIVGVLQIASYVFLEGYECV